MNTTPTDLWGQDIALNEQGQAKVAANGELILTEGVETGLQDVRLRLFTRLGELFYDTDFGSLIHDWIHKDSTVATRAVFADVKQDKLAAIATLMKPCSPMFSASKATGK